MGEVKTEPVVAVHYPDSHGVDPMPAGGFRVSPADDDGEQGFWYSCPCGCGRKGLLTVGKGFKPEDGPSWNWNGSLDKPTLTPSVHHVGHWHGWLTDGVWRSC